MRRFTLGRPINKKYLSDHAGALAINRYRRVGGLELEATDSVYIHRQRTTTKFTIAETISRIQGIDLEGSRVQVSGDRWHGLTTGDRIKFEEVEGTTELNGKWFTVTVIGPTELTLDGTNPIFFSEYVAPTGRIIGWEENLVLSDSEDDELEEGQFTIVGNDSHGIPNQITKLYNRSVRFSGNNKELWVPELYDEDDNLVAGPAITNGVESITLDSTNPVQITTVGPHRLSVDNEVTFENISGTTELNGNTYKVKAVIDDTNFTLKGTDDVDTDSSNFTAYVSSEGHVERARKEFGFSNVVLTLNQPVRIVTNTEHTFKSGDVVEVNNVSGTVELNGKEYQISVVDSNSFILVGTNYDGSNYSPYEAGGSAIRDAVSFTIKDLISDDPDDPIYVETEERTSFQTGDIITLNNLPTVTELNGQSFTITRADSRTFALEGTRFGDYPDYQRKPGTVVRPGETGIITHMDLEGSGNVRLYFLEASTFRPSHDVYVSNSELIDDGGSDTVTSRIDAYTVEISRGRSAYTGTYESRGHTRGFIIPSKNGLELRIIQMDRDGGTPVQVRTEYQHGLTDGDTVSFKDLESATELNNRSFQVTRINDFWFELDGTRSDEVSFFVGNGQIYTRTSSRVRQTQARISSDSNRLQVNLATEPADEIATGDIVQMRSYSSNDAADNFGLHTRWFRVTRVSNTSFILDDYVSSVHQERQGVEFRHYRLRTNIDRIYVHSGYIWYDLFDAVDLDASGVIDYIIDSDVRRKQLGGSTSLAGVFSSDTFINENNNFIIHDDNDEYLSSEVNNANFLNPDRVIAYNQYQKITKIEKTSGDDIEVTYDPRYGSYETGDTVEFAGVEGATELNGNSYAVTRVDSNTITLDDTDSASISEFTAEGLRSISTSTLPIDGFQRDGNRATTDITIEFEDPHGLSVGEVIFVDNIGLTATDSANGSTFLDDPFLFEVETVPTDRSITLADTTDDDSANAEFEYNRYRPYGQIIRWQDIFDISAITLTSGDPVQITVTNTASKRQFYTGDMVTFNGVGGTTELNSGGPYTITQGTFDAAADTEIVTLDGTDGDDFTEFTANGTMIRDAIERNVTAISWDSVDGYTFTIESGFYPAGDTVYFNHFKPSGGSNSFSTNNGFSNVFTVTESTSTSVRISADQWSNAPYDTPVDQRGTVATLGSITLIEDIKIEQNSNFQVTLQSGHTLSDNDRVYVQGIKQPSSLNENIYTISLVSGDTYSLDGTRTSSRTDKYKKSQNLIKTPLEKNFIADTNNEERHMNPSNGPLGIRTVKPHSLNENDEFLVDGMIAAREDNVSNTGQNQDTTTININNSWRNYAQRFRTGSNSDGYEMQSASIIFGDDRPSTGEVSLHIRSDDSNNPSGTTLANLVDPSSITEGENKFTVSSPLHLDPDTHYWVEVRRNSGSFQLAGTDSNGEDSTSSDGWQIGNNAHFISSGSWQGLNNSRSLLIKVEASELRLGTDLNKTVQTMRPHRMKLISLLLPITR